MHLWLVLFSLITARPDVLLGTPSPSDEADSMRYRGIEQLLAKFEAEADAAALAD
jgi:hypothetical protein